jgi:hypothetical protein
MTDHKVGANHDAPSPTPSLRPNQHKENLQPRHERKAWRGTVSLAVAETTSWGILYYSFGVLFAPFEEAVGSSQAAVSGAFSLARAVNACPFFPSTQTAGTGLRTLREGTE